MAAGKGFVGFHAATDTFHCPGPTNEIQTEVDPYIAMLGGEFVTHGAQQEASLVITSRFPGAGNLGCAEGISFYEEWYALKNFAKDLHVILVQETKMMKGDCYQRPLPLHLGPHARQGPGLLHVAGPPRGHLDQPVLPDDRPGRDRLGDGQRRRQGHAQHRQGDARGKQAARRAFDADNTEDNSPSTRRNTMTSQRVTRREFVQTTAAAAAGAAGARPGGACGRPPRRTSPRRGATTRTWSTAGWAEPG